MNIKARVELSNRWRVILVAACTSLLAGLATKQLVAQVGEQNDWRRTARGWEYAHAIQVNHSPSFQPTSISEPPATSLLCQCHRIVLPIAASSFILTLGCWLLLGIPNRGIVRRIV